MDEKTTCAASDEPIGSAGMRRDDKLSLRRAFAWQSLVFAIVYAVLVLVLGERRKFEDAVLTWGDQMPIVAVLRDDVTEKQANALVEKLRSQVKGLQCTVIGRREARSLLALQEPWLQHLPETLVGELPSVLELRHPALFRSAQELDAFLSFLQAQREVDFVVFNSVGHDRVIEALSMTRRHLNVTLAAVTGSLIILFALAHHFVIRSRRALSMGRRLVFALGVWITGVLGGGAALWAIEQFALKAAESPLGLFLSVGAPTSLFLIALLVLLELLEMGVWEDRGRA
ncbi:MAG: hypothetical protein ACP5UB_04955 [Candidatus Sumerlaeaceae bacterium]